MGDYNPFINRLTKAMVGYAFQCGIAEDYCKAGVLNDEQIKAISKYMIDRLGFALHLFANHEADDLSILLGFYYKTCDKRDDVDYSVGENELKHLKEESHKNT